FLFQIAHYCVPNIPANGWWHEWTFNYDVKVENNEVYLDIAEHEAKILVWLGDDWQPPNHPSEPVVESNDISQEKQQTDSSLNQNSELTQSENRSQ
ncbi:unnamed protein product, partial [Rotaria sordida]